jgi:hypothetical protein
MYIDEKTQTRTISSLIELHGSANKNRIEKGVKQAAVLWTKNDGSADDFKSFCEAHFIADPEVLDETFDRIDRVFEGIDGHFTGMQFYLREKIDLDLGELRPLDMLLGEYEPAAHIVDDLFENKIAYIILLNFPQYNLADKQKLGSDWNSRQWAFARLGEMFMSRVPAAINQEMSRIMTAAETYINEYNIHMHTLLDHDNHKIFPEGLKLISHWGLRDELKSHYGKTDGLPAQELIFEVMQRIITQEIPKEAINNPDTIWNPYDNTIHKQGKGELAAAEPDNRYQHIVNVFRVMQKVDKYYPLYPTFIKRKFELSREMTENEVETLFDGCLTSKQLKLVADLIKKRLGRNLKPFDIWYDGFKSRSNYDEKELDKIVLEKYPTVESFRDDMPNILRKLGFEPAMAGFMASKISVESSRGAGHAWGAEMKEGISRLRTRLPEKGLDYKGYNIAIHELGHCVEQTISLHKVDYHLMHGVPISGLSETFAFIFQNRDLELLGLTDENPSLEHLNTLDRFWGACEIMAVALLDLNIWRWLYDHPESRAADLKKATIEMARNIWNKYFAEVIGSRDEIILAIYSHMIDDPLYLAEYPLGTIVEAQFEEYLKNKSLGREMAKACSVGNITPQLWVKRAIGENTSAQPMLAAVDRALDIINK